MRLPGKVAHNRKWEMSENSFLITDKLSGSYSTAKAHYHLHPDIQVKQNDGTILLILTCGVQLELEINGADVEVVESTWHPEFGVSIVNQKLILAFQQSEISLNINRVN
jgi:uncharacterized heparinase superfamily protein